MIHFFCNIGHWNIIYRFVLRLTGSTTFSRASSFAASSTCMRWLLSSCRRAFSLCSGSSLLGRSLFPASLFLSSCFFHLFWCIFRCFTSSFTRTFEPFFQFTDYAATIFLSSIQYLLETISAFFRDSVVFFANISYYRRQEESWQMPESFDSAF